MGIFDIFSNSDAQNAAAAQTAAYNQGYSDLSSLYGTGRSSLTSGYGTGNSALSSNYGQAANTLLGTYGQGANALTGNYGQAANALSSNYAAALAPYMQNYSQAQQGTTQLANLLGLNGASGNASAQNTLQNMPGYQFALDQGTQNVLRNQAATGQLSSGATNKDLTDYAQGLASQNYSNYVSQLQPYLTASNNAASGIANTYTGLGSNLGNLYTSLGQNLNQNNTNLGQALSNVSTGLGQNLNQNAVGQGQNLNQTYTNQGNAAYGTQAAIGNAQATADYTNLAQSGSILGALTSGGQLLSKILSDWRAKANIEPVGELYDGQKVYRYRYKGDPRHQIGLIAQEVEEREPEAVSEFRGSRLKGVDYRRATNYAAELGRFLNAA